jgi:GABA permease
MRNPVRSEDDAFRIVLLIVVALGLIALGAWINKWLGVAVVLAEVVGVVWFVTQRGRPQAPERHAPAPSPPDEHRVLVIANETVGGPELLRQIQEHAQGKRTRILVVAPVPAKPSAQWTGDAGKAPELAKQRLETSVASMRAVGLEATGQTGEIDPVQAAEDAIRTFRPDELIVSTHPPGRSIWLEQDLPDKLRERFEVPVTHVVVDLDADGDS